MIVSHGGEPARTGFDRNSVPGLFMIERRTFSEYSVKNLDSHVEKRRNYILLTILSLFFMYYGTSQAYIAQMKRN